MNRTDTTRKAFSLAETAVSIVITGLLIGSAFVIINRSMASAADMELKMQAFSEARDNMEKLLSQQSLSITSDFGESERFDGINYETVVDSFYEPLTQNMWLKAVCSAEYTDTEGQVQSVELTNWITRLSKDEVAKIVKQKYLLNGGGQSPGSPAGPNTPVESNNTPTGPNAPTTTTTDPEVDPREADCWDALGPAMEDDQLYQQWLRDCLSVI